MCREGQQVRTQLMRVRHQGIGYVAGPVKMHMQVHDEPLEKRPAHHRLQIALGLVGLGQVWLPVDRLGWHGLEDVQQGQPGAELSSQPGGGRERGFGQSRAVQRNEQVLHGLILPPKASDREGRCSAR